MGKFERLLLELNLINARPGIKPSQLAQETEVSERTIYRDMLSLSASHIPVYYDEGYRIMETAFLPVLNITPPEYGVLHLALNCRSLQREDFQVLSKSLLSKIESQLNPEIRKNGDSFSKTHKIWNGLTFPHSPYLPFEKILERAIQNQSKVKIQYDSFREGVKEKIVHPYWLVFRHITWYLLGFSELKKEFRAFDLIHIKRTTLLEQNFKKDPNFSVEKFFENKWDVLGGKLYSVKIKFKGYASRLIQALQHHPQEKIVKQKDGSVIYSLEVEGLDEISSWILSFGEEAEVLKPTLLREKIYAIAKLLMKAHSQ